MTWEVTGPNPGFEREDILQSTLQGVLTFSNLQTLVHYMYNICTAFNCYFLLILFINYNSVLWEILWVFNFMESVF